jgi:hypothetical protein
MMIFNTALQSSRPGKAFNIVGHRKMTSAELFSSFAFVAIYQLNDLEDIPQS